MDDLDSLPADQHAEFRRSCRPETANGIIVGDRLRRWAVRPADSSNQRRITVYSVNYREMDLEFEIVGLFRRAGTTERGDQCRHFGQSGRVDDQRQAAPDGSKP
jgi:hypothetical protein